MRQAKGSLSLVVLGAVFALAASSSLAHAQHQPLALAPQKIDLGPRGASSRAAYCLDHSLVAPPEKMNIGNVAAGGAEAKVCVGGVCNLDLRQAIDQKIIAVEGGGGYKVVFRNLTSKRVSIELKATTALADRPIKVDVSRLKTPLSTKHDPIIQNRTWHDLGQVGPITTILVSKGDDGKYVVQASDGVKDSPVATFKSVKEADIGKRIDELARGDDSLKVIIADVGTAKAEAIVADLRVNAASRSGRKAQIRVTPPKKPIATKTRPDLEVVEQSGTRAKVHADDGIVEPFYVAVQYAKTQNRSFMTKVVEAIKRAITRVRVKFKGKDAPSALAFEAELKQAVADEIAALGGDPAAIWIGFADDSGGFVLSVLEQMSAMPPA